MDIPIDPKLKVSDPSLKAYRDRVIASDPIRRLFNAKSHASIVVCEADETDRERDALTREHIAAMHRLANATERQAEALEANTLAIRENTEAIRESWRRYDEIDSEGESWKD